MAAATSTDVSTGSQQPEAEIVRQLAFNVTGPRESPSLPELKRQKARPVAEFPVSFSALEPAGYELRALVPGKIPKLPPKPRQLSECSASTSAGPGAPLSFSRMFATHGDRVAFCDASHWLREREER